jgi:uncharacterized protein with HEPN domain
MPRDYKVYLDDILQAIAEVRECTRGLCQAKFEPRLEGHPIVARSESLPHHDCRAKC